MYLLVPPLLLQYGKPSNLLSHTTTKRYFKSKLQAISDSLQFPDLPTEICISIYSDTHTINNYMDPTSKTRCNRLPALCRDTRLQPSRLHQHYFRILRIPRTLYTVEMSHGLGLLLCTYTTCFP